MKNYLLLFLVAPSLLFAHVEDLYQWLEQETPQQQEWIEGQKERSQRYFSTISSRKMIEERMREVADFEKVGLPERRGQTLYYFKHRQGDDKTILARQVDGEEEVLVDPNLSCEVVNLIGFTVSPDGHTLAYGLSLAGSDEHVWRFIDLKTKSSLPECLEQIQFSEVSWDESEQAVYYIRNCTHLFRHTIGTDPEQDTLLYQAPERGQIFDPANVLGGDYILLMEREWVVNNNRYLLIDLQDLHHTVELIAPHADVEVTFVGEGRGDLFFITDEGCEYGKLIAANLHTTHTVIPEQDHVLQEVEVVGDYLICVYYKNAVAELKVFDLAGEWVDDIILPGKGSVSITSSPRSPFLYYSYTDFKTPSHLYAYHPDVRRSIPFFTPKLQFDPTLFSTEQVWYQSKDGTPIPLFLTYNKELKIDASTPVLLYGYGGFGISMTPYFRSDFLVWLESGGVLAIPNLRGGKEFGTDWYDQGKKQNKQNVFDDCIAAAEFLVSSQIGSPRSLAIFGTSNGGLLAGACLTQRPDLFRAAVVNKGVLDMLRFHLFTIGKYWMCDYGNPDDPEDYAYLLTYSPYHNVRAGTRYPSVLINTADHDDRVVPLHSYKFAAALQEANGSSEPILLRLEHACGHGSSDSQKQEISFGADMLSFLFSTFHCD